MLLTWLLPGEDRQVSGPGLVSRLLLLLGGGCGRSREDSELVHSGGEGRWYLPADLDCGRVLEDFYRLDGDCLSVYGDEVDLD